MRGQVTARAEANQLHAAIINGDVQSLEYWLTVRHADASAPSAAEPDVTPLERCLDLAGRVLDPSSISQGASHDAGAPIVGLRVLQDMVLLLHAHGAGLTEAGRQRFSGPVMRWYDDAVRSAGAAEPQSGTDAPQPSRPPPAPAAPPGAPAARPPESSSPVLTIDTQRVRISTDSRKTCNGTGHVVYLVNNTELSVSADVTTYEEMPGGEKAHEKRERYQADAGNVWQLGCDTTKDGRRVRYVLNGWW